MIWSWVKSPEKGEDSTEQGLILRRTFLWRTVTVSPDVTRDVAYLGWPIESAYYGCGFSLTASSFAHGAQNIFDDQTPYIRIIVMLQDWEAKMGILQYLAQYPRLIFISILTCYRTWVQRKSMRWLTCTQSKPVPLTQTHSWFPTLPSPPALISWYTRIAR